MVYINYINLYKVSKSSITFIKANVSFTLLSKTEFILKKKLPVDHRRAASFTATNFQERERERE